MQDLGGFPLILMPIEYCLRKLLEAACTEAQIETQVVIEMTSPEGILQAVTKGPGLMILLELCVQLKLAGAGLRIIDSYDPVPRHSAELATVVIDTRILPRGNSAPTVEHHRPATSPVQGTVTATL